MLCKYNAVIMLSWDVKRAFMNPVYGNNLCVCVCFHLFLRYLGTFHSALHCSWMLYSKRACLKEFLSFPIILSFNFAVRVHAG